MADEAQGTTAPATTTETTPEKPRVQATDLPPEALKARLEAEAEKTRRAVLAELGVTDTKDAKAALAELKTRRDAEKTESERLTARVAELEQQAKRAESLGSVVAQRAAAELASLPEKVRAFVEAAGTDPAVQLATIDRMRATGILENAPAAAPSPTQAAAPPPAASTAPRPAAPPDSATTITVDHRAEYQRLQKENPFAAAAYAARHPRELFAR